jgi:hypothetical protein
VHAAPRPLLRGIEPRGRECPHAPSASSDRVEKGIQDPHPLRRGDVSVNHIRRAAEDGCQLPRRSWDEIHVHLVELNGHAEEIDLDRS